MTNTIESLDDEDGCQTSEDNGMEKQLVITLIESELAEIIAVKGSLKLERERKIFFLKCFSLSKLVLSWSPDSTFESK